MDLPDGLETIGKMAFVNCLRLGRIAMPLKVGIIDDNTFCLCENLTTVDLIGEIRKSIASLHLEGWRNEIKDEINRINRVLPNISPPFKRHPKYNNGSNQSSADSNITKQSIKRY